MFKQMPSGSWVVTGTHVPESSNEPFGLDMVTGEAAVYVPAAVMRQFINAEAEKILAHAIELQRHALLPQGSCPRCGGADINKEARLCRACGQTL